MKILSTAFHPDFPAWCFPDWCVEEITSVFPDTEFVKLTSTERILDEIRDADVLFAWKLTDQAFHAARKLKWIHTGMAGMTWLLIPPVVESDVLVSNSRGVHANIMGEHAMALILAFARRLHDCMDFQQKAVWGRTEIYNRVPSFEELDGKTIGILGFGSIGVEVARRARCFGMRVVGFKRDTSRRHELADVLHTPDRLDAILPEIDYLVIAAPLTSETENMIGPDQFQKMKPTSVLINLARGEIVDQEALMEALEEDQIAGAGLDVFVPDPLPDGHPLFTTKNVILTPHIAGTDPKLWRRVTDLFVENIRRFRDGRTLINQVEDKSKGY